MVRVDRPPVDIGADRVASRFLTLDQRVMAGLARRLDVIEVEEQRLVPLVRGLVVGDGGAAMMPVALDDEAATALASVEVTE